MDFGLSKSPTWTILSSQDASGLHALAGILGHNVEEPQRAVHGDQTLPLGDQSHSTSPWSAIATIVVLKHDLWLELVEMKEAKEVTFLDTLSPKQDCLMKRGRPLPSSSWSCRKHILLHRTSANEVIASPALPPSGSPFYCPSYQSHCDISARDCKRKQGLSPASPQWRAFPRILISLYICSMHAIQSKIGQRPH